MSGNKIIVCDLPKKLLALRRLLFLGVTSIVFILNVSAFASLLSGKSEQRALSA
ncbi:MAG: hypothetical protein ACJZ81_07390 [Paracoccaceae bacterium]